MKVIVCGSRDWTDESAVALVFLSLPRGSVVVHGACPTGADAIAERIAPDFGFATLRYPAEWDRYGKSAGPRRNAAMLRAEHTPDSPVRAVFAFTADLRHSRGTRDCVERAVRAGILVRIVPPCALRIGGGAGA